VSFDRSEVPTNKERVHLLLKFRFAYQIFSFARGVSLCASRADFSVLGAHYGAHANAVLAEKF
jgi:hypothetical protein